MAYQAGTAFLQVLPSLKGLHTRIRAELKGINASVPVTLDTSGIKSEMAGVRAALGNEHVKVKAEADTAEARRDIAGFGGLLKGLTDKQHRIKVDIDKRPVVDSANAVALLGRNLTTLAYPIIGGAALPAITSLAGALTQASGALLVLPAAGAAAAVTVGTVALATRGMADAFKLALDPKANPQKLAAAMAALSPNARAFVTDVRTIKPAFDSMAMDVQDRAFAGLGARLRELSGTYLPVMRSGLGGVATELNGGAQQIANFVMQGRTVSDVNGIFTGTGTVVRILSPALVDVLTILRDITAEGMHYLPGLATGFAGATTRAREFVAAARESGQLGAWIEGGIRSLTLFGQVAINVGASVLNIFRASDSDSAGFLQRLVDITAKWREWTASAQGSGVIRDFFASLRDLAAGLAPLVGLVAGLIVEMVTRLGPLVPPLVDAFMRWYEGAKPVFDIFWWAVSVILPPFLALVGGLGPVLGPFVGLAISAGIAVKGFGLALGAAKIVLDGMKIAWAALNFVMGLSPFGLIVIAIGLLVAALIYAWQNSETFRNIVTGAWEAVKAAGQALWDKVKQAFDGIVAAGQAAWTWLQGIFTSIGNAALAVGAFFTRLWQEYVVPAWNGIVEIGKWALAILIAVVLVPIQIAINVLGAVWTGLKDFAVQAFQTISQEAQIWWTFLSGIFTAVTNYLGPIFSAAWNAFRDFVVGVWNALSARISTWWNNEVMPIWNFIVTFLGGIFSQAFEGWRILIVGIYNMLATHISNWWNGIILPLWNAIITFIQTVFTAAWNFLRDTVVAVWTFMSNHISAWWNTIVLPLWNAIIGFIQGAFLTAWNFLRDTTVAVWNVMRDTMMAVWTVIRDNIWNPMVNFITVTLPEGFRRGVEIIGGLWNAIKAALRTPLQAAIDIVWNNGIVKVWDIVRGIIPGLPDIPNRNFQLPGLAAGGPVEKPTVAMIGEAGPEYVFSAPAVRNMGGMNAVDALHKQAATPRQKVRAMNSGAIVEGADHNGPGSNTVGFGGVRPHVAQAGYYLKSKFGIGTVGGVGARANASDHPAGLALDFMTGGENGTQLADFISSPANWNHFAVKYIIWRQRIRNGPGGGWTPMADRGSPTANHMDHVHVSFTGTPGQGAMDGGGGGPSILELLTNAWGAVRDAVGKLGGIAGAGSPWGQAVTGFGRKIVDSTWSYLAGKAGEMMAAAAASAGTSGVVSGTIGGSAAVRASVAGIAARYGWSTGAEWAALQTLIQKESGWNPTAQNPTSTAYGLFQFLNGTWGTVGATKTSNPGLQAEAGMKYIAQKYGTPSAALAYHNAHNSYDRGGRLHGRGMFYKETIRPERVLSERQNQAFERMVEAIDRSARGRTVYPGDLDAVNSGGRGQSGPLVGTLVAQVPPGATAHEVVDVALFRLRHTRRGLHV